MNIDWIAPPPRAGLAGEWDKFVGPGQTRAELWLILVPAVLAGIAAPWYAVHAGLGWAPLQLAIAALLALDLAGGVITNATATAKRWYHRPGQGWRQQLAFVAAHALHLGLAAWLLRDADWLYFGVFYAYLLAASLIITRVRLYLQRPVALLLLSGGLLLDLYALPATPGLEWFMPILLLKLLVSHLLNEAPYASDA